MNEPSRNTARFGFSVSDPPKFGQQAVERNAGDLGDVMFFFLAFLASLGFEIQQFEACSGHVWAKLVDVEYRVQVPTQARMPLRKSHLQIEFPTG